MKGDSNMKRKHNMILVILIIIMLLGATVSFTSAFASRKKAIDNHIVFGDLELKLIENTINDEGIEGPFTSVKEDIAKANKVSRIIRVENVCENDMFVRIQLEIDAKNGKGEVIDGNQMITYDINQTNWIYKDGYYYYNRKLEKNEETENLFEHVFFNAQSVSKTNVGNELELHINVQAVQSEHNGENPLEAEGWPL